MKNPFFSAVVLLMIPAAFLVAQDINNTLGSSGTFTIKDGSTTFFSLTQSNGNINVNNTITLPVSTGATIGVIMKNSAPFMHDFAPPGSDGNTFVGVSAGNFSMTGGEGASSDNTIVGNNSFTSNTTGYSNSALGHSSLTSNTGGYNNSALGASSLGSNTTGSNNSAFGTLSLLSNTTGSYNSAFGAYALQTNTAGGNSAFGYNSLFANTTGSGNSAFGTYTLQSNTTGGSNAAFGEYALFTNGTGNLNSAFGFSSLYSNTTGAHNTAVGYSSLRSNTTGGSNTAVGYYSFYSATGSKNTAVGDSAGLNLTSGSNNTLIGYNAEPSSPTVSNEITLGDDNVSALRCNATLSTLSDARDKRDIRDLPLGLDFLMTVKPRLFNWDRREWYSSGKPDGSKMKEQPTAGFIAQELDKAQTDAEAEWLNLVLKSNPERMEATSGNLLPIVVKAIQDLKRENDELRKELSTLTRSMADKVKEEVEAALQEKAEETKVSMK
jgi:Chaperone of endosialidase